MRLKINKHLCLCCKSLGVTNENSETLMRVTLGDVRYYAVPQKKDTDLRSRVMELRKVAPRQKSKQLAIASLDGHGSVGC
jgi:hypothetical protein